MQHLVKSSKVMDVVDTDRECTHELPAIVRWLLRRFRAMTVETFGVEYPEPEKC